MTTDTLRFSIASFLFVQAMLGSAQSLPAYEGAGTSNPHSGFGCRCPECLEADSIALQELKLSIPADPEVEEFYNSFSLRPGLPMVFDGFRRLNPVRFQVPQYKFRMKQEVNYDADRFAGILFAEPILPDQLEEGDEILSISERDTIVNPLSRDLASPEKTEPEIYDSFDYTTPKWLIIRQHASDILMDSEYRYMVSHPEKIDFLYWELPTPPCVTEDKEGFADYLVRKFVPTVSADDAVLPEYHNRRKYWLHTVGGGLQFSQAYISRNWYQGGNNYLALLFNFNWDVALNTVYNPNLMFTSSLAYKLAVNSNSKEALHSYSISQDLLQYNLKAGVKAFKKWFYSYNLQFKTQIFNAYPADSPDLASAFLSPADLNMGIGMTYNTEALQKRLKLSVSISPISYNLKTCLNDRIDPAQFNIEPGRHTRSEIGSNTEVNLNWDITPNISWKSRLFLFSDYHYFQADWENTFTFNINRFLSTQFYLHPRFDSSADFSATKWHYWQLKEILSFGLSYTFSTKP